MNTTTYASRKVSTPYSMTQRSETLPPVQNEVAKRIGEYKLVATFSEDIDTKNTFKHVPGLIAFLCTLRKDGNVIAVGRGSAFLSRMNRYVERTIDTAFNASLVDAVVRGTKVIDALNSGPLTSPNEVGTPYTGFDGITDKQRDYLSVLIGNLANEDEREEWLNKLDVMTRDEASAAIALLKEY
jgi:hypothetical protein